jgi:hypothetical protein
MIPALLAAPVVEGVVGSMVGSVAGLLGANSSTSAGASSASSFAPMLRQAAARATASLYASPTGAMTTSDWSGMSGTDVQSWLTTLTGKRVHTVDLQGHVVSGVAQGFSTVNGAPGINVGGHFVALSTLNQVSWSPAIAGR